MVQPEGIGKQGAEITIVAGGWTELHNGQPLHLYFSRTAVELPIPVATRSQAWVWGLGVRIPLSLVSAVYCQVEVCASG